MITSETTKEILKALFNAQKTINPVVKGASNPFFKSKYADLNSVLDAVTESLFANDILIIQPTYATDTSNYVTTRLYHYPSGEWIESTLKLEMQKLTMQELGSAVSYARRYTLQSLLTLKAEDDDAEGSMKRAVQVKPTPGTLIGTKPSTTATVAVTNGAHTVAQPGTTAEMPRSVDQKTSIAILHQYGAAAPGKTADLNPKQSAPKKSSFKKETPKVNDGWE